MLIRVLLPLVASTLLAACGSESTQCACVPTDTTTARTDTSSTCTNAQCDATTPSIPVLRDDGGAGDVTTYGGVGNANPSSGGACNYGITGITHYAAIQVNQLPGDLQGQWKEGRACGQCVQVRARTSTGWKTTHARIVDKCFDANCGIDLGGAPATELMGTQAGRYSGEWTFVPCEGLAGVSDGPTALRVKEGSNASWSIVQMRNPPSAVDSMMARLPGGDWIPFAWAIEAENFFKVPPSILDADDSVSIRVVYAMANSDTLRLPGRFLAHADTAYVVR